MATRNRKELIEKLRWLSEGNPKYKQYKHLRGQDVEAAHMEADEILLKIIDDPEVTELFESIDKWYS